MRPEAVIMMYQLDQAGEIRGQHLSGETVSLSEEDCRGLRDSTFANGTLKLAPLSAKWPIIIVRSTVIDSDVIAVKKQKNGRLFNARFINCKFFGVFSGIDFGRAHDVERDGDYGGIEGSDFTEATLDGCRFVNVDVSTMRFPARRHVVLLNPSKRYADVAAMKWPGRLGLYMAACTDGPDSFKASVIHIPSLAKLVKCSEEEIRSAFTIFGGIEMS